MRRLKLTVWTVAFASVLMFCGVIPELIAR